MKSEEQEVLQSAIDTKSCSICKEVKIVDLFYKSPKLGRQSACKMCMEKNRKVKRIAYQLSERTPLPSLKGEIWSPIPEVSGNYEVSNFGRVKSVFREIKRKNGYPITTEERLLKLTPHCVYKYLCVGLGERGSKKTYKVHRLVATAFIPNPRQLPFVNHINGCRTDNSIQNLEWVTLRENSCHGVLGKNKTSRFLGVSYDPVNKKWVAATYFEGKSIHIGRFLTEDEAHFAHIKKSEELKIIHKYSTSTTEDVSKLLRFEKSI